MLMGRWKGPRGYIRDMEPTPQHQAQGKRTGWIWANPTGSTTDIYSIFQMNLLIQCLMTFVHREAGKEMFFISHLYLLTLNIQ